MTLTDPTGFASSAIRKPAAINHNPSSTAPSSGIADVGNVTIVGYRVYFDRGAENPAAVQPGPSLVPMNTPEGGGGRSGRTAGERSTSEKQQEDKQKCFGDCMKAAEPWIQGAGVVGAGAGAGAATAGAAGAGIGSLAALVGVLTQSMTNSNPVSTFLSGVTQNQFDLAGGRTPFGGWAEAAVGGVVEKFVTGGESSGFGRALGGAIAGAAIGAGAGQSVSNFVDRRLGISPGANATVRRATGGALVGGAAAVVTAGAVAAGVCSALCR